MHIVDANALNRRLTSEGVVEAVREIGPAVVGVTLVTPLVREAYRLASMLRETGVKLLAGGPHATLVPEEPLAHGFDAVLVGEGEPHVADAVDALTGRSPREQVPGLCYRDGNGDVRRNAPAPPPADLDTLPPPYRHLVDPALYRPLEEHVNLLSSRGCPARCAFCAGYLFGRKFRYRSAGNVLDEMARLHRTFGTRHFHFVDDSMGVDRPRLRKICRGILERELPVSWSMMTRIDSMNDEEILELAARSGCREIHYGVESGCPETLKRIHKPHTVEMVRRVVPATAEAGIEPLVFFILGFPWEDVASIEETRSLMEELAPWVTQFHPAVASILIPFPGTEIYDDYKDACGFTDWWLGDARNYDAPGETTHAHYEQVLYRNGAVLDADFFRYPPEVKRKIREAFEFMYMHNLRARNPLSRAARKLAYGVSLRLAGRWPGVERRLFRSLHALLDRDRAEAGSK